MKRSQSFLNTLLFAALLFGGAISAPRAQTVVDQRFTYTGPTRHSRSKWSCEPDCIPVGRRRRFRFLDQCGNGAARRLSVGLSR